MDPLDLAAELLRGEQLGPERIAELRALQHRYWTSVADRLRRHGPGRAAAELTPQDEAELRAMVEEGVRALLRGEASGRP